MNPEIVNLPEWTWVKVVSGTKKVYLNRIITTVYYYKTYRLKGETAPTAPTFGTIPQEAIRIFDIRGDEFIESSDPVDVYIMCANQDDDSTDTGIISVGPEKNSVDVALQDQTTDAIIVNFNQVHNSTTLDGAVAIDDRDIIVTSATGIAIGSYIILFDPASVRFSTFFAIGVSGTTITLDSLIDFDYPDGTFVDIAITDLSVDGSGTPEMFGLRGTGIPLGVELSMDVTRIIFEMTTSSAVSLDLFGNLTALTRGLLVRSRNGRTKNIFNVKTNGEIAGIMFDWTPYAATNPQQGIDGFVSRLTFGGQNKLGVVVRLDIGEDLEVHVQDNLLGITNFKMIAEGHIVD